MSDFLLNERIEANSVDPDQTAPTGATLSGSTLFVEWLQTTHADDICCIGTLRVNKYRSVFPLNARTFAQLKQGTNSTKYM